MGDIIDKDQTSSSAQLADQSADSAAVEVATAAAVPRPTIGQLLSTELSFVPVLLTLVVIMIFFAVSTNGVFLEARNLSNLVQQIAVIGVVGLGVILVLLLGEIDLSVASVSTFCAVVMGILTERLGAPGGFAIIAALLTGALVGFINGIFIAVLRVPSFIVTLAASIGYAGLLLYLLGFQSTLIVRDPLIVSIAGSATSFLPDYLGIGLPTLALLLYVGWLIIHRLRRRRAGLRTVPILQLVGQIAIAVVLVEGAVTLFERYNGVPNSTAILFGLIVLLWLVATRTSFGRHIYAVGGNAEAARRAGINVVGIRLVAFTLCSMIAALGGVLAASRGLAVESQINPTLLLQAIAAAVIGGVSLFGGRGTVWAIVLGALIIGSLENGLDLKSQGTDVKQMVEGVVLLAAVTIDALVRRFQARSGR